MIYLRPVIVILLALTGGAPPLIAQSRWISVTVRQIEPDGSRFVLGRRAVSVPSPSDLRILIPARAWMLSNISHRLDADFTIYDDGDSTWYVGDITSGQVSDRTREAITRVAPLADRRVTVEEHTYRISAAVRRGEPVVFYPFGRPDRGERGLAFEIRQTAGRPGQVSPRGDGTPRRILSVGALGIVTRPRARTERVRIDIGPHDALRTVYEGPLVPRRPLVFDVANAPRGTRLMVEAAPRPWFSGDDQRLCWRWYWSDGAPPAGGRCVLPGTGPTRQVLFGSRGQQIQLSMDD